MVHNLTLSQIIRLNTDVKSVPDNTFFSTLYCASVKDYQCVPRVDGVICHESITCQAINSRLRKKVKGLTELCHGNLSDPKMRVTSQGLDAPLLVGLVIACSLSCLVVLVCFVFWRRFKNARRVKQGEVEFHLDRKDFQMTS